MEHMQELEADAQVVRTDQRDGKHIIYLDQTVFYPQGGGQPYDTGVIENEHARFVVTEVRFIDGEVLHIGHYENGSLVVGDDVTCRVDNERRELNTRLHSAGHIADMAVNELGYNWVPAKGYHFPDGPYIEYHGSIGEKPGEQVAEKLNEKIVEILSRGLKTEIRFMPKEEMAAYCRHVPEYLPVGKPGRIVLYGDFGVPCGGTHVAELNDVQRVNIRKVKGHGDIVRVAYEL
jgi:Ser-tRNA(Ala) deacylase AlaX